MTFCRKLCLFLLLSLYCVVPVQARYSVYNIDSRNGLSSMFAFSLHQDVNGLLWIGTYDGLSLLGGASRNAMDFLHPVTDVLNGSMVEDIVDGENGCVWLRSNNALCKANLKTGELTRYTDIYGNYRIISTPKGDILVLSKERGFLYYNKVYDGFRPLSFQDISVNDYCFMTVDDANNWTIITRQNTLRAKLSTNSEGDMTAQLVQREANRAQYKFACSSHGRIICIDNDLNVYMGDSAFTQVKKCMTLPDELTSKGDVSSVLYHDNRIIISFYSGGVYCATMKNGELDFCTLPIKCGVFKMLESKDQELIWVATDGEGVKMLVDEKQSIHNELYSSQDLSLSKPIRAFLKDKSGDLWIATKGDGLLCYRNYKPFSTDNKATQFTKANSGLLHDSNYSLTQSHRGGIWVSGDGSGINYVDVATKKIVAIPLSEYGVYNVHDIAESGDSLWLATYNGLFLCQISWNGGTPSSESCQVVINNESQASHFQTIRGTKDCLWLANREAGLLKWDLAKKTQRLFQFSNQSQETVNDVIKVVTDYPGKVFCATKGGLIMKSNDDSNEFVNLNDKMKLGTQSIRSAHYGQHDELWVSTAHQILCYNIKTGQCNVFSYSNGINVMEFSDCASYYDPQSDMNYFGGTNGFSVVKVEADKDSGYMPPIVAFCTAVGEGGTVLYREPLTYAHDENDLTIRLYVNDFLDPDNYSFEYQIDGVDKSWMKTNNNHEVSLSNLAPGSYCIVVRYLKGGVESETATLHITIRSPWYFVWPMKFLYFCLIVGFIAYAIWRHRQRLKRKQQYALQELEQRGREEVYRSKLHFFTNLTHQFSTPLTLIGGPCDRILENDKRELRVLQYAQVIKTNAARLQDVLRQMMELTNWEYTETGSNTTSQNYILKAKEGGAVPLPSQPVIDNQKRTILIVNDDADMLWLLHDLLSDQYNVLTYGRSDEAMKSVSDYHVDLIITEYSIEPFDGAELCRQVTGNLATSHIPVVVLSSSEDNRVTCMESGAQIVVIKPFNLEYLKSIVGGQLKHKEKLANYYNSSESSYDIYQGRKLHAEDRKLLEQIKKIVISNLTDKDLSTKFIADQLGYGVRSLYRKLEGITDKTPKDMIRDIRLSHACSLLKKSKLSMEEVCYQSGFNNRGTFYKIFAEVYGCTPKQYREQQTA